MIPALFLIGIIGYVAAVRIRLSAEIAFGLVWLISVWLLTLLSHSETGFVSPDEIYFSTKGLDSLFANRSLWIAINTVVSLFTDNIIGQMRILNLGFLILLYGAAVLKLRSIPPLLIAICLSYAACIAALNLRDVAILLATLHILAALGKTGSRVQDVILVTWKNKISVMFLFMLRPQMGLLLLASALRLRTLAVIIFGAFLFLQSSYGTQYFYNYAYYTQNFDTAIVERAEAKEYERTEPSLINIGFWSARFVLAPDPFSSARRLLTEPETHPYGRTDLAVRTLSRFALYILFFLIAYRAVQDPKSTWRVLSEHALALKFGLLFTLLYALFNFGASHERVKMVVLLLLLYLFDQLRLDRQNRKSTQRVDISHPHKLAGLR
ncbi:hypothetical protein D0Y83_12470 [Qipengyuania flava]|uniref:Uncharacterized protein n=1 Tax=Qipengyuania flava TaxID=192812 RepID=A0A5P6ND78_9SPHN|nr:hypothetical protein [Qipengyuania flava]QFI63991.1 hypothetical protein D0Y83_12470 [Qipengyuania flava]